MNIGKSIKKAMIDRDMSNKDFAENYGVTESTASSMKKLKNMHMKSVEKLAKVFGLTVSEFIALGE